MSEGETMKRHKDENHVADLRTMSGKLKSLRCMLFILTVVLFTPISLCHATSNWDLIGNYTTEWIDTRDNSPHLHSMTINSMDLSTGIFDGTGVYLTDPLADVTWSIHGIVTGDSLTAHLIYTSPTSLVSDFVDTLANIDLDGTIHGNYTSSYGPVGPWWTIEGQATSAVPEPCTMLLFGSGLVGLVVYRRKFKA
jgi:hypothetical protein